MPARARGCGQDSCSSIAMRELAQIVAVLAGIGEWNEQAVSVQGVVHLLVKVSGADGAMRAPVVLDDAFAVNKGGDLGANDFHHCDEDRQAIQGKCGLDDQQQKVVLTQVLPVELLVAEALADLLLEIGRQEAAGEALPVGRLKGAIHPPVIDVRKLRRGVHRLVWPRCHLLIRPDLAVRVGHGLYPNWRLMSSATRTRVACQRVLGPVLQSGGWGETRSDE